MNWAPILHALSVIAGFGGFLAVIGVWVTQQGREFLGLSQEHLFNDAIVLFLAAIVLALGTIIHGGIPIKKE